MECYAGTSHISLYVFWIKTHLHPCCNHDGKEEEEYEGFPETPRVIELSVLQKPAIMMAIFEFYTSIVLCHVIVFFRDFSCRDAEVRIMWSCLQHDRFNGHVNGSQLHDEQRH